MIESFETYLKDMQHGVYDMRKDGKCIGCGNCCSRFLPVTQKELNQIHRYIEKHHIKRQQRGINVLADKYIDLSCPFMNEASANKKCTIYDVRPLICRDFICEPGREPTIDLYKEKHRIVDFLEEFFCNEKE